MRFSIFASKDTPRELRRFDTPDEAHGEELATAYMLELVQQGYRINDVYEVDADGYPVQEETAPRRRRHGH